MAKKKGQGGLLESVLDRLTDADPRNQQEVAPGHAQSMRQLKASLRRDLEWLLNTRRTIVEVPDYARELEYSVFTYGLPDLTSFSSQSERDQQQLLREMETAIGTFEPRLLTAVVTMLPVNDTTRVLRFQIEGLVRGDPAPERIVFDTVFDPVNGQYQVGQEASAR
ncbi:MAG TPA: type VI secretion system baseplate subunit TssE [Bryobacteraceae bacterium]|nr:type VI secretion system baseplate subunit TssE [Bryobacteraceae bacterium]